MAPLFSKVDLNKLWHDVQNEETLICAKFGKELFNISKVIGRKKVAQFFFDSQCIYILVKYCVKLCVTVLSHVMSKAEVRSSSLIHEWFVVVGSYESLRYVRVKCWTYLTIKRFCLESVPLQRSLCECHFGCHHVLTLKDDRQRFCTFKDK